MERSLLLLQLLLVLLLSVLLVFCCCRCCWCCCQSRCCCCCCRCCCCRSCLLIWRQRSSTSGFNLPTPILQFLMTFNWTKRFCLNERERRTSFWRSELFLLPLKRDCPNNLQTSIIQNSSWIFSDPSETGHMCSDTKWPSKHDAKKNIDAAAAAAAAYIRCTIKIQRFTLPTSAHTRAHALTQTHTQTETS